MQAREPRPGDRARARLRDLLDLHPALHPLAVLRLRLRLRRLPGELALRASTRSAARRLRRALSRHAARPAAPSTTPNCWRRSASTPRDPAFWQSGLGADRADDRRAGGDGEAACDRCCVTIALIQHRVERDDARCYASYQTIKPLTQAQLADEDRDQEDRQFRRRRSCRAKSDAAPRSEARPAASCRRTSRAAASRLCRTIPISTRRWRSPTRSWTSIATRLAALAK